MNQKSLIKILIIFLVFYSLIYSSCSVQKFADTIESDEAKYTKHIITAPIVAKNFIRKNGDAMDFKEYYIVQSANDYYIKFCESNISRKELEKLLAETESEIKTLNMEVAFRTGYWDICNGDLMMQSRVGDYVVILKIINPDRK